MHGEKSEGGEPNSSGGVDLFAPRSQDYSILSDPEQEDGHDTTDILNTSVEPANISASSCGVNIHDLSVTSERDRSEVNILSTHWISELMLTTFVSARSCAI